jgi:hypothetical protein
MTKPKSHIVTKHIQPWTDEEVKQLTDLQLSGVGARDCAKRLGRTLGMIVGMVKRLRDLGTLPPLPQPWPKAQEDELRRLIDAGKTFGECAAALGGRTRESISAKVDRMGMKSRSGNAGHKITASQQFWSPERVEKLKAGFAEGKTAYVIARELGGSEKAIKRKRVVLGLVAPVKVRQGGFTPLADRPKPQPVVALIAEREGGMTLVERFECSGCAWPVNSWRVGNGADALYCGEVRANRIGGAISPYCEGHIRRLYRSAA